MKKILNIGILLAVLAFFNCKNKETQPEEIIVSEKTNTEVSQEIDTILQLNTFKEDIEKSESDIATQATTTEVTKTSPIPVKIETTTKTVTKPIIENKTEVVTNTPVETKIETKTEVIIKTPVETKTEPVVIEKPNTVDKNTWIVPSKYVTMKNPIPAKQDAAIGKSLFDKHCKSCHGKEGYGNGPKAAEMKGDLGDFSTAEFQKQTDGELFYKTTFGRNDMPEFAKKVADDEDRWLIVNYMRTLKE